jgi:hypothetical protein
MKPSRYAKIECDRRAKWATFERLRGTTTDTPFIGTHYLQGAYEETLDALNYLEHAAYQIAKLPTHVRRPYKAIAAAAYQARCVANRCLGAIETLRRQGVWEEPE